MNQYVANRIAAINTCNKAEVIPWRARPTDLSKLSYNQKKVYFGGRSNYVAQYGYEYYGGGIYVPLLVDKRSIVYTDDGTGAYVQSFDWRNRHGKNWNTPVKSQAFPPEIGGYTEACWAFASIATTETFINQNLNDKKDLDLSEQDLVSCSGAMWTPPNWTEADTYLYGGFPNMAVGYIKNTGIVTENDFPFAYHFVPCSQKPVDIDTIVRCRNVTYISDSNTKKEKMMELLINKGNIGASPARERHSMSLTGYGIIDTAFWLADEWEVEWIPTPEAMRGKIYWIFKNSAGAEHGHDGYTYEVRFRSSEVDNTYFYYTHYFDQGVEINGNIIKPKLVDEDNDGYYVWGVGERPSDIPSYVPLLQDGDDSDRGLGGMDAFGHSAVMKPFDLYIGDTPYDKGIEPLNTEDPLWESPNIWIRNNNDGGLEHQNPIYQQGRPCYIYVRVKNKGAMPSPYTNTTLRVYWSNAGISLTVPAFQGNVPVNGVQTGGLVGEAIVRVIPGGGEQIFVLPWYPQNPQLFQNLTNEPWHYCLLAEVSRREDDPTTPSLNGEVNDYVKENNNVAWKNVTIINTNPTVGGSVLGNISGVVSLFNPNNKITAYQIELQDVTDNIGSLIQNAEVSLELNPCVKNAWIRGGSQRRSMEDNRTRTATICRNKTSFIDNVSMNPNEFGVINVKFNFLSSRITDIENYKFRVILREQATGRVVGGETYEVIRRTREPFSASIENSNYSPEQNVISYTATSIDEPALYIWVDEEGNLISDEIMAVLSNNISDRKIYLEVVSVADGFKDYTEIDHEQVQVHRIISISPNPAKERIDVSYETATDNVQFKIISVTGGSTLSTYNTTSSQNPFTINTASLFPGKYLLVMLVNNNVVSGKLFDKE
ncbi:C1 family peptidase [Porphyromonas loveana]